MEKLTELNITCLANIPMMVDVINSTIGKLETIFLPYQDRFEDILKKKLRDCRYNIEPYSIESNYNFNKISATYSINAYRNKNRAFDVDFGYSWDSAEYVVFFQISDVSEKVNMLSQPSVENIIANIPKSWEVVTDCEDDKFVCLQFNIDDSITEDKIEECAKDFIKHLLSPIIELYR